MQQNTLKHVAMAIMDPETKEKMMDHLAEDTYEEMKARVFKYLVHVKGISYEEPKTWGSQLNQAEGKGEQDNKQSGDWEEEPWNYQETLGDWFLKKDGKWEKIDFG